MVATKKNKAASGIPRGALWEKNELFSMAMQQEPKLEVPSLYKAYVSFS